MTGIWRLPAPGVDPRALRTAAGAAVEDDGLYGLADLLTGGAVLKLSVFALGVLPAFLASLAAPLLTIVVPRLEVLRRAELDRVALLARSLVLVLAVPLGAGLAWAAGAGRLLPGSSDRDVLYDTGAFTVVTLAVCLVGGTALVLRLSEVISARGVGHGPSVLFFAQTAAVLPGRLDAWGRPALPIVLAVVAGVSALGRLATRRTPVQFARGTAGHRGYGATPVYVPLPLARGGFGWAVCVALAFPLLTVIVRAVSDASGSVLRPDGPLFLAMFPVLVLLGVHLGSAAGAHVSRTADVMVRQGAFVPGIRPGRSTFEYLQYVNARVTVIGSLAVTLAAFLPVAAPALLGDAFAGVSLLVVTVAGLAVARDLGAGGAPELRSPFS